jgi:cytochrome c peroxidase
LFSFLKIWLMNSGMKPNMQSRLPPLLRLGSSKTTLWIVAAMVFVAAAAILLLRAPSSAVSATAQASAPESDELIGPIEPIAGLDPRKVQLGEKLFNDPQLSHNNKIACSNCHHIQSGGTDGRPFSIGINGAVGQVASLTVLNSGFNLSFFWDGRAETLEQQAEGPLQNPLEMGSTWDEVLAKLQASPDYVESYQQIYKTQIQPEGVKELIAVFERSLTTPNSRFDQFLRGNTTALTAREQQGFLLFKTLGCVSCHQGVNMGGNMYQKLGIMAPYFEDRGHPTKADLGRFNVTGNEQDKYMFKVPTLRNIALTAPYFHDGHAKTLEDAVHMMGKYQLGRELSEKETGLVVEFLRTLTGELNGKAL